MKNLIVTICLSIGLTTGAWAHKIAGIRVPDWVKISDEVTLPIYGAGLLRYKVVFKGYVLALYLPRRERNPLRDVSKQLTFHYFWDIEAEAFADAAEDLLRKNLVAREFNNLRPKIREFHNLYVNVKKNDRYHLRYQPTVGTQLFHNDKLLGTVKGKDFAQAYFGIWLGNKPLDAGLKKNVLTKLRKR